MLVLLVEMLQKHLVAVNKNTKALHFLQNRLHKPKHSLKCIAQHLNKIIKFSNKCQKNSKTSIVD